MDLVVVVSCHILRCPSYRVSADQPLLNILPASEASLQCRSVSPNGSNISDQRPLAAKPGSHAEPGPRGQQSSSGEGSPFHDHNTVTVNVSGPLYPGRCVILAPLPIMSALGGRYRAVTHTAHA